MFGAGETAAANVLLGYSIGGHASIGRFGATYLRFDHRHNCLSGGFGQVGPCLDDRPKIGVDLAGMCVKCAGFCAALIGNCRFPRGF